MNLENAVRESEEVLRELRAVTLRGGRDGMVEKIGCGWGVWVRGLVVSILSVVERIGESAYWI